MRILMYVATFLGGIFGALILFSTFTMDSAPQQGAAAAVAVACVVIPYCMARVIGESHKERLLETLTKPATPQQPTAQPSTTPPNPMPHAPPRRNPFAPKSP